MSEPKPTKLALHRKRRGRYVRPPFWVSILTALFILWGAGHRACARELLIFYANETSSEALGSLNYRELLSALDGIHDVAASAEANGIRSDALASQDKANRDVLALENAAVATGVSLTVFTNALALQNKYLRVEAGAEEERHLSFVQSPRDPVTKYSPLALTDNFNSAITAAVRGFSSEDEIILIISSHGTEDFAILPRVAGNFTLMNTQALKAELANADSDDLGVPSIQLRGIRKIELWKALDAVTRRSRVRLSLVFLETCQSAAASWSEYFAIPDAVERIAHTGFSPILAEQFDYARLSVAERGETTNTDLLPLLISFLHQTDRVYFDSKYSYWRWPLFMTVAFLPLWAYFVPLATWLFLSQMPIGRVASLWKR